MVICLQRGANNLHMVQLMPLPPHHLLLHQNPEWLSFWYRPTQVVLEKKAVKRSCICVLLMQPVKSKSGLLRHTNAYYNTDFP